MNSDEREMPKLKYTHEQLANFKVCPKCGSDRWIKGKIDGMTAYKCFGPCGEYVIDGELSDLQIKQSRAPEVKRRVYKDGKPGKRPIPWEERLKRRAWGKLLREERERQGLSRIAAADASDISLTTYQMMENGNCKDQVREDAAATLGIRMDDERIARYVEELRAEAMSIEQAVAI